MDKSSFDWSTINAAYIFEVGIELQCCEELLLNSDLSETLNSFKSAPPPRDVTAPVPPIPFETKNDASKISWKELDAAKTNKENNSKHLQQTPFKKKWKNPKRIPKARVVPEIVFDKVHQTGA